MIPEDQSTMNNRVADGVSTWGVPDDDILADAHP
jgi:hypothetical protein